MLKPITGGITSPKGFLAAGVKAGIKQSGKEDVAVIYSVVPAAAAAVFTTNDMAAAPVILSREHIKGGVLSAIVVNSGCANACTGEQGMADAQEMVKQTAELLNISPQTILVSSTGIIGVTLPMAKVSAGILQAVSKLSVEGYDSAMQAIMTTDTFAKTIAYEFKLGGMPVRIAGIAKGAGMIHPNMATMLGYITTDANISSPLLKQALDKAVSLTFNMITVDGDTSTNDTVCVLANGQAGNALIDDAADPDYLLFAEALQSVCRYLAQQVVRDGEGATKFLEITVKGALSFEQGKKAAMSIAKSPLVKTAFFGQDPNWGRILCAVGYSGSNVQPARTSLAIGGVTIVEAGLGARYDEALLRKVMSEKDITVVVDLGLGQEEATVWTCDFSYEYVKINGEYHT
ncbi:bifunctional glutamate N-acetyltransferase/amino-acid acetyltransferase ArgJ [Anaerospora hongkongensis]|uniref:bifunctional glutamate N-acetyltransferase/amino-acid acetyltransferase ArgJ n=1 Tax=Anaerospora hongkongensis TaxID=244830 RepID=UPI0028994EB3|nr:bifunctional glutamate N-acetyltransferase/amino-acid acetyltransferase ArgJ [Anaerospora hongkongensis]